ncbi:MAG: hypothetical protein ACRD9R_19195 [Pyrinomonadaceae bacterium]
MGLEDRLRRLEYQSSSKAQVCGHCHEWGDSFARLADGLTEQEIMTEAEAGALADPDVLHAYACKRHCPKCDRPDLFVVQVIESPPLEMDINAGPNHGHTERGVN